MPCQTDPGDRDFYWQDVEGLSGDGSNELFGQFVDFEGEVTTTGADMAASTSTSTDHHSLPIMTDPFFIDHKAESTSSAVSTADEYDFLSNSSQLGPTASSASHDIDPKSLSATQTEPGVHQQHHHDGSHKNYFAQGSVSDTELPNLEGISLYSPTKNVPASHPSSPTPPNTVARKQNKFVEALSSTIRKATTLRKGRKPLPGDRSGSPEPAGQLKLPKQRSPAKTQARPGNAPVSPSTQNGSENPGFIHGFCDDPFNEAPQPPNAPFRFFSHDGFQTPQESPPMKSEPQAQYHNKPNTAQGHPGNWSHPAAPPAAPEQWSGPGHEYVPGQTEGWWDVNLMSQPGSAVVNDNAQLNYALHAQHAELPYQYYAPAALPDPGDAGLMIHMPQPHPPQPTVVTAQTYLPPPPPVPASDPRPARPPRARSSGARHMSCSPRRKTPRVPSAPASPQTPGRSRHSSGGSVSSIRSNASGTMRLPGSMPGTPCSVRKRRSRDASNGGGGGGDLGGFVNFTPSDGGMLMTGVAPSGSSKTKARREKEASDRRRRLSEAAMKAVAAAGGDVDKLMEQGFTF